MSSFFHSRALAFIFLVTSAPLWADVVLAPLFRDGAVLQRDKVLPVWGRAEPGERVHVQFAGQTRDATAGPDGRWRVQLAALPANATPATMEVAGKNTVSVTDILIGDVWLCSGQSNMNWRVRQSRDAAAEIAAADNVLIRHFDISNEVAEAPQLDTQGGWRPARPELVGDFSAVAYFFAREVQPKMRVPIGMIKATPGGSGIEAWLAPDGMESEPYWAEILARRRRVLDEFPAKQKEHAAALAEWNAAKDQAAKAGETFDRKAPPVPEGPKSRNAPSGLFNSNISPVVPFALRGFLWYQGEGNASRHQLYSRQFPTLIAQWRRLFGQGELPFYFVQLADFAFPTDPTGKVWAFQREAQAAALALPATGMAVAIDVGDRDDIHPINKQEVGKRLARLALARTYGEPVANHASPRAISFVVEGGGVRVRFDQATTGIVVRKSPGVPDLEVAGEDRIFYPAAARIEGDSLIASSSSVRSPVAVRYLWRNAPEATLFNMTGLPVAPFRSDQW